MLRKKLSKLIVAVMAAVMLSGGMSGVGQAVFASSNAGVVATQVAEFNVTNKRPILDLLKDENVVQIGVVKELNLSNDIVEAINNRTAPLTIVVQQDSVLTVSDSINLNGKDANGNSKVTIVRGADKEGAMLKTIKSNSSVKATVTGVKFDNSQKNIPAVENEDGNNITLILDDNTLSNGGSLSYNRANNTYTKNKLGAGSLTNNQNIVLNISGVAGATAITMGGTTSDYNLIEAPQQGLVTLTVTDGNNVGEKSEIRVDNAGSFSGEVISGLKPAQVYNVTGEAVYTDGNGNTYTRKSTSHQFTTINFSSSVTNVTNNSATININHGNLPDTPTKYPLTLTINGVSYQINDKNMTSVNVTGLASGTRYSYEIKSGTTVINTGTFTTTSSTINFSSSVTNIGNNSATININHGNLPDTPTKYPLTLTINGVSYQINDKNMTSIPVAGLAANTSYTYEIKDKPGNVIDTGTFTTTNSTISGGGSTGGSVVSGDLTTNDINRADIKDVSVSIPVGNTTLANSLRDGRDYKTNIEGVTVTYSNGKVEFTGLVPEKDYKDLTITYTDKDGRTRTVKVSSFKTKASETKLRQFIVDVYRYSLDRVADERGFAYWEDQLKNKKTSPDEFVKNLLNEPEFINKHKTTTEKVEALYQVIVNRKSDSQGLSFWTKKYDDLVAKGYSESMALRVIVDEMVNEQEFKNRVRDLAL